jgi:hypothetical protein
MVGWLLAVACRPAGIREDHRVCVTDDECSLIALACCPCGNGEATDAVNRSFAADHAYHCTESEVHDCAMAGACVQLATPVALCRGGRCAVERRPIQR